MLVDVLTDADKIERQAVNPAQIVWVRPSPADSQPVTETGPGRRVVLMTLVGIKQPLRVIGDPAKLEQLTRAAR